MNLEDDLAYVVIDCEADGPAPGLYSLISVGAVAVKNKSIAEKFYGQMAPISSKFDQECYDLLGVTREEHLKYPHPELTMQDLGRWCDSLRVKKLVFVSDNPSFDFQFINYYFHKFIERNPFGYSARRIGDIYSGLVDSMDASSDWKSLRKTSHTHNALDDAIGNAEAFIEILGRMR